MRQGNKNLIKGTPQWWVHINEFNMKSFQVDNIDYD